jgi:hypothetical protein
VDAPAGEQEQQQQPEPATPGVGPATSAVAADKDDKQAAALASRTTSVNSNGELSAAAAAGVLQRSAPISKAAVRRRRMSRQAGLPHVLHLATKHHSSLARSSRDQAGRSPASTVANLQQQQQFGLCQLHSRGSSRGGRGSAGGAGSSSSSSGGGAVNLLQLQAVPVPSAALVVQSGGQQQQMQVTITAGPEVVHGVLIPAVR